MARVRMVKPDMFDDDKFSGLSIPARLLFACMITKGDDGGKERGSAKYWRKLCFSPDVDKISEADVAGYIKEIGDAGMILAYTVNDEGYLWITNYHKHQWLNRPRQSPIPHPPLELLGERNLLPVYLRAMAKLKQAVPREYRGMVPEQEKPEAQPKAEEDVLVLKTERARTNEEGLSRLRSLVKKLQE